MRVTWPIMRLATFNLESLDDSAKSHVDFAARLAVLRPALERIDADVICLQEVNAQRVASEPERAAMAAHSPTCTIW